MNKQEIASILGDELAQQLLEFNSPKVSREQIYAVSGNQVDEIFSQSNRSEKVLNNLRRLYNSGRLAGTGYLSILPVDQGIEHSAGYSFSANPMYFDPENIVRLAIEGGCNAVASTFGVLGLVSKKYADQIPFVVKINHNELLTYPNKHDQVMFGTVKDAYEMGAAAVGATIYFGSENSAQKITEVAEAFSRAHELGMATILWCYTRNSAFKQNGVDYHTSADLTGQANHLGVTIQADIIKQKLPDKNGGYKAINTSGSDYGKFDDSIYTKLSSDHPIDLARYQVLNCYAGKIPLISSGGDSSENDHQDAVRAAVINKRAGGAGLIMGRKAFKKPFDEGVKILNLVQDVYASSEVTVA